MKKIISTMVVTACAVAFSAIPAFAATTASITPATVKVVTGQKFNVVISVNPNGGTDYAEKLVVNYPADLLSVIAFTYGSNAMALTQSGYDSIDNTNGVMVKTAGYTGGIKSVTPFGTITLVAKKSGTANISISSASQSNGSAVISGTGSTVTILSAVVPTPKPATEVNTANNSITTSDTASSSDLTPVTTVNGQVVSTTSSQAAAAALAASNLSAQASGANIFTNVWLWILVVIIIIIGLYFIIRKKK